MIYTLTLNPALDYTVKAECLNKNGITRSGDCRLDFGGKGINVSTVLARLNVSTRALGFIAGFTGDELERQLNAEGVECDFCRLKNGSTRINVKIRADAEYDINADGPEVSEDDIEALIKKTDIIGKDDILVIAGSVSKGMPKDIYERIIERVCNRGVLIVADAEGELLKSTLKYRPFLIKPNHIELGDLFGVSADGEDTVIACAKELQKAGAKNVLVSRAEKGAILLDENGKIHIAENADGTAVNSVGCGDSTVAGFLAGYVKTEDYSYALRLGVACGNATAYSEGLAKAELIDKLFNTLN